MSDRDLQDCIAAGAPSRPRLLEVYVSILKQTKKGKKGESATHSGVCCKQTCLLHGTNTLSELVDLSHHQAVLLRLAVI